MNVFNATMEFIAQVRRETMVENMTLVQLLQMPSKADLA